MFLSCSLSEEGSLMTERAFLDHKTGWKVWIWTTFSAFINNIIYITTFTWLMTLVFMAYKCGKRVPKGKSPPRDQYNTNSPAQPACKKNVMVDKFFAPHSTLGSWLTSNMHQLKSMWMAGFCSHRHCLTSPFLLYICVTSWLLSVK